jgi:multidrug transporter EmrE-like cation transporter
MKSPNKVKFPLLQSKHALIASIITGVIVVLCLVAIQLNLSISLYAGSGILVTCLMSYLLFAEEWSPAEIRYVILVFAVGTGVLTIAERNPMLLGSFSMGPGLGPFLGSLGLLCGLLVALPVLFTFPLTSRISDNIYLRSLIGALLVTVPAILISYNGEALAFFTWFDFVPSATGFIAWFVTAFFLHFAGQQFQVKAENPMALPLYIVWISAQVILTVLRFAS